MKEIVEEVKSKLNKNQLYNLENFKPCLIPPKGKTRIGQVSTSVGIIKGLERIRSLSEEVYNFRKDKIINRYIERISLKFPYLKEEEIEKARQELSEIIDQMRSLSDVEFDIQKESIAQKIKNVIDKKHPLDVDRIISHFLLNPQAIPVLEEKLSQVSVE
jgi:hypothetical protein